MNALVDRVESRAIAGSFNCWIPEQNISAVPSQQDNAERD
jgi:hypothetical protein